MISIKGLHKFYNKGKQNEIHVINDVSLDLPQSGMVAIFGKSGCGKTTLLNVIGGLDSFAQGELSIEGQSIATDTDVIRNQYIGYIFQNYNLNKNETCFENVADALRLCGIEDEGVIESRVTAALKNVGMDKYSKRTPDTLSGGQQQRIAIARAIVKNPPIILADEPTGNLDEANTVMIMDLLKAIAKDHLVLLVTHEAKLVDYYCDTIIELSDGKVASVKHNSDATGLAVRDKNSIYLGELEKSTLTGDNAQIEYYGEKPADPIKLKIVNNGGKIYIQIDSDQVQIIDEYSEIKLQEGIYKEIASENAASKSVNMESLPPIRGTRFGKLFSFKSSVKSGYRANFKNSKKRQRGLRGCMCLFAAVIVFMSAVFGTAFGKIIDTQNAYNHNVFYVYTPSSEISQRLNAAVGSADTGIDFLCLSGVYPTGDYMVHFRAGSFETFQVSYYEGSLETNAVFLDTSLTKDMRLVEGRRDNLKDEEILISTKVASALLEKSSLGYIKEEKDLIGLVSPAFTIGGKSLRIAGIVESDESAIYLTELAMARYTHRTLGFSLISLGSDYGVELSPGEAVLAIAYPRDDVKYPQVGETIKIQGRDIKVTQIERAEYDYHAWLGANEIEKIDEYTFFSQLILKEQPELIKESEEFHKAIDNALIYRIFEYYDYIYSELDLFIKDYYFFSPRTLEAWLYVEKDVDVAKYIFIPEEYYKATAYKRINGAYPSFEELEKSSEALPYAYEELKPYYAMYEDEFYITSSNIGFNENTYMVSEADYIALAKQLGETHPSATYGESGINYGKPVMLKENGGDVSVISTATQVIPDIYYSSMCYTVIHSSNPDKTDAYLKSEFGDLESPSKYHKAIITPNGIFDDIMGSNIQDVVTSIITMAVILALMSVCMYFIMRSSLMVRIKEVGIYRAIGVSRKNLVFKFFVEALVLTTLTVLIGYLVTSAFLFLCLGMSSLVAEIFYYPLWLAGCVLAVLYGISLFFGTLPIISLLRKTPSEILAKYDI